MTETYSTGTITLTNGSAVVTGDGTAWEIAQITGGTLYHEGLALLIASVDSDTELTLKRAWTGATASGLAYDLVRDTAYDGQVARNAEILARLLAGMEAGTIFKYNAEGDTAGRDFYDTRPKGFAYLDISVVPAQLFIKTSNAEADWSGPFSYGQGEQGDVGPEGPPGPVGVNWQGEYSGATAYLENDVVRDNGSAWIALQDTTGNAPPVFPTTSNAYWELIAVKGLDGTGTGDVVGPSSAPDGGFVVFDGTTGKLIKNVDAATMKAALAILAADVGFNNSVAELEGDPATVQEAIEALAAIEPETGKNDALFALEIADLKGGRLGMVGGIADAFDSEAGIDTGASTNEAYDATNDWYKPVIPAGTAAFPGNMTGNSQPPVTVSAGPASLQEPYLAFDSNASSFWQSQSSGAWIKIDLGAGNAVILESYLLQAALTFGAYAIAAWTLEGSNNDTDWTVVDTRSGQGGWGSGEARTYTITGQTTAFRYYRITVTAGNTALNYILGSWTAIKVGVPTNMTLISQATAVASQPSTARIAAQVIETGAVTINTDLTFEVSRDGGTTWALANMSLASDYSGIKLYEANDIDLSGQPAGTSMKWRAKTLNNKNIAISGVVMQWS